MINVEGLSLVQLCCINPGVGGVKGQRIYKEIEDAKTIFYETLGVRAINEECEKLRTGFLKALKEDRVHNFEFSKEVIVEELSLPFELFEPKTIEVQFFEKRSNEHCMHTSPQSIEDKTYRINVYLETLQERDKEFIWDSVYRYGRLSVKNGHFCRGQQKQFTVETAAFHEFLHASGDAPWRGRIPNVIRTNIIGLNAILNLLEKKKGDLIPL